MHRLAAIAVVLAVGILARDASGVPSGRSLGWDAPMGTVLFDGTTHAAKGLICSDCHDAIFKMKRGAAKMRMADINAGRFCGECHNGVMAFESNSPKNCLKCHKTPVL